MSRWRWGVGVVSAMVLLVVASLSTHAYVQDEILVDPAWWSSGAQFDSPGFSSIMTPHFLLNYCSSQIGRASPVEIFMGGAIANLSVVNFNLNATLNCLWFFVHATPAF